MPAAIALSFIVTALCMLAIFWPVDNTKSARGSHLLGGAMVSFALGLLLALIQVVIG